MEDVPECQRQGLTMSSRRALQIILVSALTLLTLFMGVFLAALLTPADLPARLEAGKGASVILDRNGRQVANLYAQGRVWVSLPEIPVFLRRAVVATEDVRYYKHHGLDPRSLARALWTNLRAGRVEQGGSTITQQLAKITFLSSRRTIWRKLEDAAYALRIEREYSKEQILESYLNQIYLGHGAFGVEAAAQTYFGRHIGDLNHKEQAMLAGLIRGPEYYSPFHSRSASDTRTRTVLALMHKAGYLDKKKRNLWDREPINLLATPGRTYAGGYFVAEILADLGSKFGWTDEYIRRAGLEIRTTMDTSVQKAAEDTLRLLPVGYKAPDGSAQPQGAIVVLDPKDGSVLALVGGRDYLTSPFDRATRAIRQPGSAMKPFAYAAALEVGYSPDTIFVDEPTEFWIGGRPWQPQNYDHKYRGPIPLSQALADSVNTVAVRLVQVLGPRPVFDLARRMGLGNLVESGKRNDLGLAPLALGGLTKGVSLLELTAAYAAFDNGGYRVTPYLYSSVVNHGGSVIASDGPRRQQVISSQTAYLMTLMMRGVVEHGTGVRAAIGRPSAGKTGTTTDYTNGWYVGYTPELAAGIWIGNDRGDKPMRTKQGNLGSGMASALWGVLMSRVLKDHPIRDFIPPETVIPAGIGEVRVGGTAGSSAGGAPKNTVKPFTPDWWEIVRRKLRGLTQGPG